LNKLVLCCSIGETLWIDMFENRLCTVSTRNIKLTLTPAKVYEPASSRLREKMLIETSRRQPVRIIDIRISKQNGKDDNNQQQIWTSCTFWIVLWVIINKVDCGLLLFCGV
jgi:hypothetical protein